MEAGDPGQVPALPVGCGRVNRILDVPAAGGGQGGYVTAGGGDGGGQGVDGGGGGYGAEGGQGGGHARQVP